MKKRNILIIILIVLIIIELSARGFLAYYRHRHEWYKHTDIWAVDSTLGWFNKPNYSTVVKAFEFTAQYRSDSNGYRYSPSGFRNDTSIIFIGDSFVQGCEVNSEDVFTSLIQKEIEKKVINAGVLGYGTDQEYLLLERIIDENTEKVYVFFYLNDLGDIIKDMREMPGPNKPRYSIIDDTLILTKPYQSVNNDSSEDTYAPQKGKPLSFTYRVSSFIKNILHSSETFNIIHKWLQFTELGEWMYRKNLVKTPYYMTGKGRFISPDILHESIPVWTRLLNKFKILCNEKECELILVIIPSAYQYDPRLIKQIERMKALYDYHFPIDSIMETIESIAHAKSIKTVYPLEHFRKEHSEKPVKYKINFHWNKNGHKLMKSIIMETIQ